MRHWKPWLAVAAVSVTANLLWQSAGQKFPNSPIGRLNGLVLTKPTVGGKS